MTFCELAMRKLAGRIKQKIIILERIRGGGECFLLENLLPSQGHPPYQALATHKMCRRSVQTLSEDFFKKSMKRKGAPRSFQSGAAPVI